MIPVQSKIMIGLCLVVLCCGTDPTDEMPLVGEYQCNCEWKEYKYSQVDSEGSLSLLLTSVISEQSESHRYFVLNDIWTDSLKVAIDPPPNIVITQDPSSFGGAHVGNGTFTNDSIYMNLTQYLNSTYRRNYECECARN